MVRLVTFVLAAFACTLASASPVAKADTPTAKSMPFVKRFDEPDATTGVLNVLQRDQARARQLITKGKENAAARVEKRAAVNVPVTNSVVSYLASVGVGSPPSQFSLIVDTGSSNTWVGATKKFVSTSTTKTTNDKVAVTYGSGSFSGNEVLDQVTLANGLVIAQQSIGVATKSTGFQGVDGILGVGPVDLTVDTLSPDTNTLIPTVTDNLFTQGTIPERLIGVSFEPTTQVSAVNGEITFGGTDSSKFTGAVTFAPITGTSPSNEFWGVDQSVTFGSTSILSETAGIVDTGTTLVLLASDAFQKYQRATGATVDNATGLLTVASVNNLQNLNFNINGATFSLTPNAQIFPRSLNTAIGANANSILLIVNDIGSPSGEGLDFINGQTFLERFYTVFDTTNQRVGFANTPFTQATTN